MEKSPKPKWQKWKLMGLKNTNIGTRYMLNATYFYWFPLEFSILLFFPSSQQCAIFIKRNCHSEIIFIVNRNLKYVFQSCLINNKWNACLFPFDFEKTKEQAKKKKKFMNWNNNNNIQAQRSLPVVGKILNKFGYSGTAVGKKKTHQQSNRTQ